VAATGWFGRHLGLVALGLVAVTVALVPGLGRLEFSTSQDAMVDPATDVYRDNVRYQERFGGEVMILLFEGTITDLVTPEHRAEFDALEQGLARAGGYHTVVSPVVDLEYAADQLEIASVLQPQALGREQRRAADEARAEAAADGADLAAQEAAAARAGDDLQQAFGARVASDAARLATAGEHSLANPGFVEFLLFDEQGEVRPSLRGAFPDSRHALMVVRLLGNTSIDEQSAAAATVAELAAGQRFDGFTVTVTGSAALLAEINDRMRSDIATTGLVAVVVMTVILLLVLRARWRLLSLAVTAVGITWGFAVVGYLGIPLTMVTISGLPILIGLGVDFAIQLHSRYEEEAAQADGDPLGRTVRRLGPALGVAMVAAVVGFLALRLSSVPMIRDFGVLLAVGAAMAFLAVWTVTPVALVWRDRRRPRRRRASQRRGVERAVQGMAGAFGGHPAALASAAVLFIGGGVWAQQRTPVESDPERFVPQDSSVLRDLHHLRDVAGTSADMGLFIEADDVTRADVLAWMADFEARALEDHPGQLLRSASIASIAASVIGAPPTPGDADAVLAVTPPALERMFVSKDRTEAQILFSVGHLSLDDQEWLLDELRHDLDPPAGVRVTPSGLAVIGIATVNALESNQMSMAWAAAAAVLAWLLLVFRSLRRAGLVLVPVLTAVGASALLVELLGLQVSALGALSSPLVVAICTEFSVLIVERYLEERRAGQSPDDAVATASLRIGRAFGASGLTVAGGFAALAVSGFPLLTSFGIIVAVNIVVSLVVSLVLLPPLLTWGERPAVVSDAGRDQQPPAATPSTEPSRRASATDGASVASRN
jgi:hydrophobe/amphiphile efflux-3 (HAE3) family protein